MKIIAECGATKSNWRLTDRQSETAQFSTGGINISTMDLSSAEKVMTKVALKFQEHISEISWIHMYTAGVITEQLREDYTSALKRYFPRAEVELQTDLVAAARATCGQKPGIAAILGTGSNSCLWDGERIIKRVNSSGFILGDEGSAATLGKIFLADFLKGLVPEEIASEFSRRYPSDYSSIITNVYGSQTSPSGYLGSFAPFIMEFYSHPYIAELVDGNFRAFFRRCLKQYDTDSYTVGIVGGFGYALRDIIGRIADEEGIGISSYIPHPIDSLVTYHQ